MPDRRCVAFLRSVAEKAHFLLWRDAWERALHSLFVIGNACMLSVEPALGKRKFTTGERARDQLGQFYLAML
ncbi:MAG: hypothetical protein WBE90_00615 [Xanthobacteraceae bacterium]|jgi:hypothetical protein